MPTFYDSKGDSHVLTERLGSGGEGTVYVCPNDFKLVAKIYHEPITDEKAEKLRWMADNKNDRLLKVAAWIVDTLRDAPDGKIVGFLMPNVKAKEIHELYSLKSRRVYFPDATWKFLVHTAANLARAFYSLHKDRHIMGDVNHGNCVVLADGTVKLIDCDSYSISKGDFRYPCEVGVATHLAPELQGVNLRGTEREAKHDNFGLAVIIFQLLFLGRHPFSGNFLGDEDKSIEDCIRELRFAYGDGAKDRWVKQPPGTLPLSAASPRVALMFERAFLTEDRPEPHEWIEALEDLGHHLKQCAVHPGHHYFDGLPDCPFCEIEAKTGLMLFPFTGEKLLGEGGEKFNIFTVENLIAGLNIPNELPILRPKAAIALPVSPEILAERKNYHATVAKFVVGQFVLMMFLIAVLGTGVAFMGGVMVLIFSLVYLSNSHQSFRENAEYELELARKEWNKFEDHWKTSVNRAQIEGNLSAIKSKVAEYGQLQRKSREQFKDLQENVFQYKLDLYLKDFKIEEANISGANGSALLSLKDVGIDTASDIEAKRLRSLAAVSSFVAGNLLEWRKELERNFQHEPEIELPEAETQKFAAFVQEKRRRIEKEIETMFIGLRSSAAMIQQKQQQFPAQSKAFADKLLQAENDVKAVGTNAVGIAAMVMATFLTLGIGSALLTSSPPVPPKNAKTVYGDSSATYPPLPKAPVPEVRFDYSDSEIKGMTDAQKYQASAAIIEATHESAKYAGKDYYRQAEPKLRMALRILPEQLSVLAELGDALSYQGNYQEAYEVYQKSVAIDSSNPVTKSQLGVTEIKLKKYRDAVEIFTELLKTNPNDSKSHFNLGLAYKGLKNYKAALEEFRLADKLLPDDAETHKEIYECSKKLGIEVEMPLKAEKSYGNIEPINSGIGNGSGEGTGHGSGNGVGSGR